MRHAAVIAATFILATSTASAQDYPSRPIKIIVPNPPGGAGDITARLVGQKLTDALHQPVVVENQPGASGSIAINMLKRSPRTVYLAKRVVTGMRYSV